MSSKNGIVIKGTMDFQSVLTFLEDVVNSFRQKTVCVQRGEEFVTLKPGETIEMELEAVEKKGKQKLSLELSWREEIITEAEEPFKVSCEVPEPAPEEEVVTDETAPTEIPEDAKAPAAKPVAGKTATVETPKGLGDVDKTPKEDDKAKKAPAKK